MHLLLQTYKQEIQTELTRILHFWAEKSLDPLNGGFIGKMDFDGIVHPEAEKGGVLNARILWTFSAAANFYKNKEAPIGGGGGCRLSLHQSAFSRQNPWWSLLVIGC